MKKSILLGLVIIARGAVSVAQHTDCNRAVWFNRFTNLLPKEVCIPKGNYHITQVHERTDINEDGLEDFIFEWNKNPLQDGDTLYVTIYAQNQDSTFSHFRTFNNLYPIYFERYDSEYNPPNKKLSPLHKKYNGEYPFLELTFEKGIMQIIRIGQVKEDLIITYRYDKNIKNWRYEKTIRDDYALNIKEPYDLSKKLGPTIDNFTYFIWDEEEE